MPVPTSILLPEAICPVSSRKYREGGTRLWLQEPYPRHGVHRPLMSWVATRGRIWEGQATGSRWQTRAAKEPGAPGLTSLQFSFANNSSDPCWSSHTGAWDSIGEPAQSKDHPGWSGKARSQKFPLTFRLSSNHLFPYTFEILITLFSALQLLFIPKLQRLLQG